MRDPYDVLGVEAGATETEIRSAYRALVQIYHPDRFASSSTETQKQSHRRMVQVTEAFDLLQSNSWSRVDLHGEAAETTDWWYDGFVWADGSSEQDDRAEEIAHGPLGTSADYWLSVPSDGRWFNPNAASDPERLEPFGSWPARPEWAAPFIARWLENPQEDSDGILIGCLEDGLLARMSLVQWVSQGAAPPGPTWMVLVQGADSGLAQLFVGIWGLDDPEFASERCQASGVPTWVTATGHLGTAVLAAVPQLGDSWRVGAEAARLLACVVGTSLTCGVEGTLVLHDPTSGDSEAA